MASNKLRIAGIVEESIVDGEGIRFVVFTQGCPHRCPGCHNPATHSFEDGMWMDIEEICDRIKENPLLQGVTFSGGEPFMQAETLFQLGKKIKALGLDLTVYTGFVYEDLLKNHLPGAEDLLSITDILIDGPYVEAERDLTLQFRGSKNQRILNLKLERNKKCR